MPRLFAKLSAAVLLLLAAMHALCAPSSHAEDLNKITATGYVTDLAGTLDPNAKANLEALCTELQQKTGAQMAIVTVHSLEGRSVEDYAADLYKHLGVGPKKDDRGVLLLVSPDEKKYRIEVGYGLEPVINDARAGDVGRAMVPDLRANNYNHAIQTAAWQLAKYVADDRGVTLTGEAQFRSPRPADNSVSPIFVWGFLILVVGFFLLVSRGARGAGGGSGCLWFLLGMLINSGGGANPNFFAAYGDELQKKLDSYAGSCVSGSIYGERVPRFENHVRINKAVTDAWGIPVLHIVVKDSDNELNMAKDAANTMEDLFKSAGWEILSKTDKFYPPGYSIHEVGTCRMGDNPKTSVLNKWNQSHDIKNLFVVDGSAFVTCGWQNPTMTIVSLSMRASEYLAEQMSQRNL